MVYFALSQPQDALIVTPLSLTNNARLQCSQMRFLDEVQIWK